MKALYVIVWFFVTVGSMNFSQPVGNTFTPYDYDYLITHQQSAPLM